MRRTSSWHCSVWRMMSGMARSSSMMRTPGGVGQMAHAAQVQGKQRQDGDLGGERLGAGDADLRTGVQVDAAVGFAGDGAADDIAQGQRADGPCASIRAGPPACRRFRPTA